ncbi:MAG: Nif3-like dinuclear metal center hexameric protein [Pseudomonadales bacterium]|nr:Nif3-like dinuclear metal center hexameric protein [Pseudomonadales bacterium]
MALLLNQLHAHCNTLLSINAFKDYCPNGLQVQAADDAAEVKKIVTGVTASEALIDRAIELKADVLLVHHGYFWKGEPELLSGIKGRRIRKLMQNGVSLLAYHLPLDAHPQLGNNVQLAKMLGFNITAGLDDDTYPIGLVGGVDKPQALQQLSGHIEQVLQRKPLVIGEPDKRIENIAWCTGAAQSYIEKAAAKGVDCFISGEISEPTVHLARELGVAYIAAGHHATERYGIKALGESLAAEFAVEVCFVDIDNPV